MRQFILRSTRVRALVKVVGYSYPWDYLEDPHAATRRECGVDVVAVAAAYHAGRVVSPLHPTRRVMEVPQSALYVRYAGRPARTSTHS